MKHGIVFSGGGFKGAYQLGVLEVLRDFGIEFEGAYGISVGSLIAVFAAMDKIKELREMWLSVIDTKGGIIFKPALLDSVDGQIKPNFKEIIKVGMQGISRWELIAALTSTIFKGKKLEELGTRFANNIDYAPSLLDFNPLLETLKANVFREDIKMPYGFGATSLFTSLGEEFTVKDFASNTDLCLGIAAGATMPIIAANIPKITTKRGDFLEMVDGGLRTVSPIGMLFDTIHKTSEEEDWTIWNVPNHNLALPPTGDLGRMSVRAGRSLDTLLNQINIDDGSLTTYINDNAEKLGKRRVTINTIMPEIGSLGGTLDSSAEMILKRIEIGKTNANNFLKDSLVS